MNYPKPYSNNTKIDKSGFVVYRRRVDERSTVLKGAITLDNRSVVPYNLGLLKKFKAHINIEWCCKTSAIKYLFKYITKGVDRATMLIKKSGKQSSDIQRSGEQSSDIQRSGEQDSNI